VNGYEVLQHLDEPKKVMHTPGSANIKSREAKRKEAPQKRKRKIVVIGDCHARGCTIEINQNIGKTFEVTGYVSSGAELEIITNTARKEIDGLTKEDVVVIWGGANNIAKNEAEKGIAVISNFVKQRKHTNILIVNAPKRHDLPAASCVNNEVTIYNRKLYKRMKAFEYVKIIDSEVHREYLMKHGMHMNTMGKELMARRITQHIRKTFLVRQIPPHHIEMETRAYG
jgi:hypothetical protein